MTGFLFWDWWNKDHDTSGGSSGGGSSVKPDGIVEGTSGNDVMGVTFTDVDGDKMDGNDALLAGEKGDQDIVVAGKGNDKVYSGSGDDEVYGGGDNDSLYGGTGDDVLYGDEVRSSAPADTGSKTIDCKSFWDYDKDCTKWFDWGGLKCSKLSWFDSWDNHLQFDFGGKCDLKSLTFDNAYKGCKLKLFDDKGNVLKELTVSTSKDILTLDLDIKGCVAIEIWTNNGCEVKDFNYTPDGSYDTSIEGGVPGDDLLVGGLGNDTAFGNAGDDTIKGDEGNDKLYGNSGDDSIEGGSGNDVIYGDNAGEGGSTGGSGERESFEWDKAPDPNGHGAPEDGDDLSGGFTQDTGSVVVTFSVIGTNESPQTYFQDDQQKVHSITTDGNSADSRSSVASRLNSDDESATYQWEFSSDVGNVSFRINDIDSDSRVTVQAYDADGNLVEIDVRAEWGTHLTLSDADGVGGSEIISHRGDDTGPDTDPDHSVLVNIPGPISRLVITHEQDGHDTSEINITDIYFDALEGTPSGDGDGNDTLLGGSGDDSIFGEGGDDSVVGGEGADDMSGGDGNDTFTVSSAAEGAGDTIVGGNGPDENTDLDILDLRGAGRVTINATSDGTDAGSQSGTVTFADGSVLTFSQIEQILTDPQNETPDAVDDTASVDEDGTVTIDVLANDTDPDGDPLTISSVEQPDNGTVEIVGGQLVYTPDPDFNGTETITYTVTDPSGATDTATVTITVNPVNDAPEAMDDVASTDEDAPVTIDVLANDTDVDGDPLTIQSVEQPANGTVEIVDGKLVYTPDENFNGEDTITYTVTDPNGNTSTATVVVTVDPVNDAPEAVDDTAETDEDTPVTIDVLANDTDVDGDDLTIQSVEQPANGTVEIVDGKLVYTPDPDFSGTETITYTIVDEEGLTDTATVTVTVNDVNDAPTAVDDTADTDEDTPVTIDVLANDTDPDGDPLTIASVEQPANGTVEIVDGKLVYTPDENFNGEDTITYTVTDPDGNTSTATVVVTVDPVNDAPDAVDDTAETDEDTPVTIDVLANDTDVDGDDLTIQSVEQPANGTVEIVDGKLVYTPDPDFSGTETITYTIVDEEGLTDTATVTVTVNDVNDAPTAVDDTADTD
ncbi:Ig-like domain-containing protein, partial [Pseudooceanicola sp. C21-150M6]|uniref:Ig-like domain-containing protein n=1 Tax=Pseudooceanicola sp. C21-150M6 TaxID=3434355 RepID=UPI003D7F368C